MKEDTRRLDKVDVVLLAQAKGLQDALLAVETGAEGAWEPLLDPEHAALAAWTRDYRHTAGPLVRVLVMSVPPSPDEPWRAAASHLLECSEPGWVAFCGACSGRARVTLPGDVIVAKRIVRPAGRSQPKEPTLDYQIPARFEPVVGHLRVSSQAPWLALRPRSREEQRHWVLAELQAGRNPIDAPHWDELCPEWADVLETLWKEGLLEPDRFDLTPAGERATRDSKARDPASSAPPPLPRLHPGRLAVGNELGAGEEVWNALGDAVTALDQSQAILEFLAWSSPTEKLIVQGVSDHAEPNATRRFRGFAGRAAAEVCLQLARSTPPETGLPAPQVLADHRLPLPNCPSPCSLLEARFAVVPFHQHGCTRELDELERWTESDPPLSVRLVVGPSGAGKTRLLMYWTERLRHQGWVAGFWTIARASGDVDILLDQQRSVLMVIDDAGSRRDLCELLCRITERPRRPFKFRVALLERSAGAWWDLLITRDEGLGDVLLEYDPYRLAPISEMGSDGVEIYRRAAKTFASLLGLPAPEAPRQALAGPHAANVLGLHMAALADVLEVGAGSHASKNLVEQLLEAEQRAWRVLCEVPDAQAQEFSKASARFSAAVTLLGGLPDAELAEALLSRMKHRKHLRLIQAMAPLYPAESAGQPRGVLGPVAPALLGDALVSAVLADRWTPTGYLNWVFEGAHEASLEHGFGVLAALLPQDGSHEPLPAARQQVMAWLRSVLTENLEQRALPALRAALSGDDSEEKQLLGPVLMEALVAPGAPDLASVVARLIPERSVGLGVVAVWALRSELARTLDLGERARILHSLGNRLAALGDREASETCRLEVVEIRRELARSGDEQARAGLGQGLLSLGLAFGQRGDLARAEEVRREAVDLYRDLVAVHREAHLPGLASSLLHLGRSLSQRRRWEEAHQATRDAVEHWRELGRLRPNRFLPDLAAALNDLGIRFGELGHGEAAEEASQEALTLFRELAGRRPVAIRPGLAATLTNLAQRLREAGLLDASHEATREATDLYRVLVVVDREQFLPGLAGNLNTLSIQLSEYGEQEAALEVAREAVAQFRELGRTRPTAYLPELGGSLNNLGNILSELGQLEEAEQVTEEAVALYRELARTHPGGYLPRLALSLSNLGQRLGNLGRREAALDAAREAADLYRDLAMVRPGSFRPEWAASLTSLGMRLSEVGQPEAAYESARDATALYRELLAETPAVHRAGLAASLNGLALRLSELGQREGAYEATREATGLYRDLASERPLAFLPHLATSLNNLGNSLSELGQREAAYEATHEATELYRELAAGRQGSHLGDLATSLHNLGSSLSGLGQREAALEATSEATELYRELSRTRPDTFRPRLAVSLATLGRSLSELGQREAAYVATREATELYRRLIESRPGSWLPGLAASLNTLGRTLSELGKHQAAYEATRESTDVYRELAAHRPDVFLPHLASGMNNLGLRLRELGEPEAALVAMREACDLNRQLTNSRPEAFVAELGASLNNLGVSLAELGQTAEALEAAREAVSVYQELARARPEAFTPHWAAGLNNLGTRLRELGRPAEAVEPTRKATELYRELARHRPDAFLPDLGGSLHNLATTLSDLGEAVAALGAARESVACWVSYTERQPATLNEIGPALARSFQVLVRQIDRLELDPSSEPAVGQALGVLRRQGGLSSILPPRNR